MNELKTAERTQSDGGPSTSVIDLRVTSAADVELVGGKGANLGEMLAVGLPVPGGFAVTAPAYLDAMDRAATRGPLREMEAAAAEADPDRLVELAAQAQDLILTEELPADLRTAIADSYTALGGGFVAVRSSATAEDTADTSFAGMNETFTNIMGLEALYEAIRRCWASLYGARVMAYRAEQQLVDEPAISVVVQRMVAADRSGVMFTVDPAARDELIIEAAFGLGEVVVAGTVEPDTYRVNRATVGLRNVRIGHKHVRILSGQDGDVLEPLEGEDGWRRVLNDEEIVDLARIGLAVENHYGSPQDIEWCYADGELFIVQSRPITTIEATVDGDEPVLTGLGVGSRRAGGEARILTSPKEGGSFNDGEVLVADMTSPDWVPIMRRAAGLITNAGGSTCHAAIVSRELGVPAVVGTRRATEVLRDGDVVTIDAASGHVLRGDHTTRVAPIRLVEPSLSPIVATAPLATKLYANLAMAERAEEAAALPVDGVGLLRGEFMVTDALDGVHPRQLITDGGGETFIDGMDRQLSTIVAAFAPRPVVYRTMDFRSNEFRGLVGGDRYEPHEENPMIGFRGAFRYITDPETFSLELEALARVAERFPNLHMMIPFVRTSWELEACLAAIDRSPLGAFRKMKRWVMAEVPSIIPRIPDYASLGIDGVSIGGNDLTQLMLGVDRDAVGLSDLFDPTDDAVLWAIEQIIDASHANGLTTSFCGMAPSADPGFAARLVALGIDSISVDPDAVPEAHRAIATAERRLVVGAARRGIDAGGAGVVRRLR